MDLEKQLTKDIIAILPDDIIISSVEDVWDMLDTQRMRKAIKKLSEKYTIEQINIIEGFWQYYKPNPMIRMIALFMKTLYKKEVKNVPQR